MIGHKSSVAGLKTLCSSSAIDSDPSAHSKHLSGESDRVHMILSGSTIEDILTAHIFSSLAGEINAEEKTRLFGFDGPIGTFSNKVRIAQALGLITRASAKHINLVREIRNAAAHAPQKIDYGTAEIQNAILSTLLHESQQTNARQWDSRSFRSYYSIFTACLSHFDVLGDGESVHISNLFEKNHEDFLARQAARN